MKLLIIYNPQAGNGRARALLTQVLSYLDSLQLNFEIKLTEYSGHAKQLVANSNLAAYSGVIASGGDGTLFEVINGYYQNSLSEKPPLGLIPNGTGNAFLRELGLAQSDWKKAIDIIANNHTKKIDVGRFISQDETHYFLNIVGIGFVTQAAEAAIPLKWIGNAAYTIATLFRLIKLKSQSIQLVVDGNKLNRDAVFVEVANSRFTGTSFMIAPNAKLDDGLLDVILLNKISRLKILKLFTSIYDGSHINYPEIETIQARQVSIIENEPGKLLADGEIFGRTPIQLECLPLHLKFLWPKQG